MSCEAVEGARHVGQGEGDPGLRGAARCCVTHVAPSLALQSNVRLTAK